MVIVIGGQAVRDVGRKYMVNKCKICGETVYISKSGKDGFSARPVYKNGKVIRTEFYHLKCLYEKTDKDKSKSQS